MNRMSSILPPRAQAAFEHFKSAKSVPAELSREAGSGADAETNRRNVEMRLDIYERQDNSSADLDPREGFVRTEGVNSSSSLVVLSKTEESRSYWTQIQGADEKSEGMYSFGEIAANESYSMNVNLSKEKAPVTSMGWYQGGDLGFFAYGG